MTKQTFCESVQIDGQNIDVYSDDDYLMHIAQGNNPQFEPNMVKLFKALVQSNDVVADIGANIGLTAILFASLAREVHAFEPGANTFKFLERNLESANVKNVVLNNIGLGAKAETQTLTYDKNDRSGAFISSVNKLEEGHQTETIEIDTLDNYYSDKNTLPNILKLDVEGFEQYVLTGGQKLLNKQKPIIILEMNHFCLNVLHKVTLPDFLDSLRDIFPFLYAIEADNSIIADMHNLDEAYNVMHKHVVHFQYPNLVGGFTDDVKNKLDILTRKITTEEQLRATEEQLHAILNSKLLRTRRFIKKTLGV